MLIAGKKPNFYRSETVAVSDADGNDHIFTLTPPNPTFFVYVEKLFPMPAPPKTVTRDAKGRVERDESGNPVLVSNDTDVKYRQQRAEQNQLQNAVTLHEALRLDKNITFETPADKKDIAFYAAIRDEFIAAFSLPVYQQLLAKALSLLSIEEKEIADGEKSFRSGTGPDHD